MVGVFACFVFFAGPNGVGAGVGWWVVVVLCLQTLSRLLAMQA